MIEELIGEEIVDETDLYVDVHRRIAVAKARLTYHRQSVSAPSGVGTRFGRRRNMHRSHSQPHVRSGIQNVASPMSINSTITELEVCMCVQQCNYECRVQAVRHGSTIVYIYTPVLAVE